MTVTGGIDIFSGPVRLGPLTAAAVSVGLGVFLALVLRAVIRRLHRGAPKTGRRINDLILSLVRTVVPPYVLLTGLWSAVAILPFKPAWHTNIGLGIKALMVLIITIAVAKVAGDVVHNRATSLSGTSGSATIFVNITRVIIFVLGVLLLLNSVGIAITPLLTALGVGGLAVALALQDTLQNLFAGIHILASRQIQPGAYILLDNGMEGYVEDTNWRNTVIRQTSNNFIVVPNDTLAKSILTNYHQPDQQMSVSVPLRVSFDSDLNHVERVAIEVGRDVMETVDGGVPGHEPLVRYNAFGDSSITFNVILRTSEASLKGTVIHEFIKRVHSRFQAEGIDMPYPVIALTQAGSSALPVDGDLVSAGARERGFD